MPVLTQTPPSIRPRSTTATDLAELCRRDGGLLAAGTRTDDDEVVFQHRTHGEKVYAGAISHADCISAREWFVHSSAPRNHRLRRAPDSTVPVASVGAMTNASTDFDLNRPGALIAALPAVLGFVPEKSLVLVASSAAKWVR